MRLYVAGPMTGLPEFNYPAFHDAAARLRALGFDVENPAENEPPESGEWADWIRLGLAQVLRVDGLALLPRWELSRGARLEVHVAAALGLPRRPVGAWIADGQVAA